MAQHFFVTRDIRKVDGKAQVVGQIITDGTVTVSDGGGSDGGSKPPIKPVDVFQPKWILPPYGVTEDHHRTYNNIKSAAQAVGYETVEHEDFSYPPPR